MRVDKMWHQGHGGCEVAFHGLRRSLWWRRERSGMG